AIWQDFLILVRLLGGGAHLALALIVALMALGVGLICLTTSHLFHPASAAPASILSVALLSTANYGAQFIDTSLLFFLSTMAAGFLYLYARSRRLVALGCAAVFTGLAFSDHVAAVCLVPSLLVVTLMAARSPIAAIGVAAAAGVSTALVTSAL